LKRLHRRLRLTYLLLIAACATQSPVERPAPRSAAVREPSPSPPPSPKPENRSLGLYAADEALRDVLSGELQFIGMGRWPGISRSRACAFRNDRIFVVNVYCTLTEAHALRIEVYSPVRGRVRIYAEANGPVSARNRTDYFTFMAESGAPPGPEAHIQPLVLTMSYPDLRDYEQQRYDAYLPSCFGGKQNEKPLGACLGTLGPHNDQWSARNRAFLEHANDDWYRVIRQLRTLATRYGSNPD
jgi:hypothetical protein